MTKLHADASPSSSNIWINCPASVTKARGRQRLPTPYTREGTAAHQLAELRLRGKKIKGVTSVLVDNEDVPVTPEMLDAVDIYVSYVEKLMKRGYSQVETRVDLGYADEDISGTSDFFNVWAANFLVENADFKYGQGYVVDPGSSQNRIYGLGVLNHLGPFADIRMVRLTIVQPRTDERNPIKSVDLDVNELISWELDVLKPAVARLAANDPTETPGDHCRWCVRAGECHALAALAQANAQVAFGDIPPDPTGMTNDELGGLLGHAQMVVDWFKKLQAEASQRIDKGQHVPGWKLVPIAARRKWSRPDVAINELVEVHGLPEEEIVRIETIGTVEKVMKRYRVRPDVLDPFTIKESSGSTLVSEKDKRPAIDNSAQNVFGNSLMSITSSMSERN